MTKEMFEARLKEIEKAMTQILANYNVLEGGKQECLYWLKKINERETLGMSLEEFKTKTGATSAEIIEVKHG